MTEYQLTDKEITHNIVYYDNRGLSHLSVRRAFSELKVAKERIVVLENTLQEIIGREKFETWRYEWNVSLVLENEREEVADIAREALKNE